METILNKRIYKLIDTYFNITSINSKTLDSDGIFTINTSFNNYECNMCVKFKIDYERYEDITVNIKELNKCHYSGTETLDRLELLIRGLNNNIKYMYLDDQSYITYEDFNLNLGIMYILTNGMSWYNKLGFKQENYKEESNNWNIIRYNTFNELDFTNIRFEDWNLFRGKNWYDDGLQLYSDYVLDEEINVDNFIDVLNDAIIFIKEEFTTECDNKITNVVGLIFINIKNKTLLQEDVLKNYLFISLCSYLISYTRFPLIKMIK